MSEPQEQSFEAGTTFARDDFSGMEEQRPQRRPSSHAGGFLQRHLFKAVLLAAAMMASLAVFQFHGGATTTKFMHANAKALIMQVKKRAPAKSRPDKPKPGHAKCPDGYVKTHSDVLKDDANLREESGSVEDCAKECDGDDGCLGFAFDLSSSQCWVSQAEQDCAGKKEKGVMKCVKGDEDKCAEEEKEEGDDDEEKAGEDDTEADEKDDDEAKGESA